VDYALGGLPEQRLDDGEAAPALASGPAGASHLAQGAGALRHALADIPVGHGLAVADDHGARLDSSFSFYSIIMKLMFKIVF